MLIFCNTPDESETRPNYRHCYTITKFSSVPAEWFCRGIRRVQRGDDELVPVAFEIGGVSGAVCAGVPARGFVRPRASRTDRAACGGRERARRRAALRRPPPCAFPSSPPRTPPGPPLAHLPAEPSPPRVCSTREPGPARARP